MFACPSKSMTGLDCPGCGMQRSVIALLEGNLWESFTLYPALLPLLITFGLLAVYLFKRKPVLAIWLRNFYIGTTAIVLINFLLKVFWLGLR